MDWINKRFLMSLKLVWKCWLRFLSNLSYLEFNSTLFSNLKTPKITDITSFYLTKNCLIISTKISSKNTIYKKQSHFYYLLQRILLLIKTKLLDRNFRYLWRYWLSMKNEKMWRKNSWIKDVRNRRVKILLLRVSWVKWIVEIIWEYKVLKTLREMEDWSQYSKAVKIRNRNKRI
jgi:hypothetical protein